MQILIFALVISVAFAAPGLKNPRSYSDKVKSKSTDFVCPKEDIGNNCTYEGKDCLYAYPNNCSSFIACKVNADNTATPEVKQCPPPMVWNDNTKLCDTNESTCQQDSTPASDTTTSTTQASGTSEQSTTQKQTDGPTDSNDLSTPDDKTTTTTTPIITTTTTTTQTSTTAEETTTQKQTDLPVETTTDTPTTRPSTTSSSTTQSSNFICPVDDINANNCTGPKDCMYPNPEDCGSFIKCEVNPDGTGKPVVTDCPDDLEWNDNTKQCDHPFNSTCNRSTSPDDDTITTTEEITTIESTQTPITIRTTETTVQQSENPTTEEQSVSTTEEQNEETETTVEQGENPTTEEQDVSTTEEQNEETETTVEQGENPTTEEQDEETETMSSENPSEAPTSHETTESSSTTTSAPDTTTSNSCNNDDDSEDNNLNLNNLCSGCSIKHLVVNPNSQQRYVECNGGNAGDSNTIQKCSPGLLFDSSKLTCDYAGLVNPNGPPR